MLPRQVPLPHLPCPWGSTHLRLHNDVQRARQGGARRRRRRAAASHCLQLRQQLRQAAVALALLRGGIRGVSKLGEAPGLDQGCQVLANNCRVDGKLPACRLACAT